MQRNNNPADVKMQSFDLPGEQRFGAKGKHIRQLTWVTNHLKTYIVESK